MNKKWIKTAEGKYTFFIEDKKVGETHIDFTSFSRSAVFHIQDEIFHLNLKGFWKNNFEISDSSNNILLTSYVEKWYANATILEYQNKKYKLIIRNNPFSEWVIKENDNDLLAYGLSNDDKKLGIRITTSFQQQDYLFDFLLWYLFVSIATENFGDDFLFQQNA